MRTISFPFPQVRQFLFTLLCLVALIVPAGAATFVITSTTDSTTPVIGQLRYAIQNASAGDTIVFSPITFPTGAATTISLVGGLATSSELIINKSLKILGPGAGIVTIQGTAGTATASGRVFNVTGAGTNAVISGLTISGGNDATTKGAGILNDVSATLTVQNCVITDNQSSGPGGGGGVANNTGTLTLSGCTLSGNTTTLSGGGFENDAGSATLVNCTITANSALNGAGVSSDVTGTTTILNCTIAGNTATGVGAQGGGVNSTGTGACTVQGTIIATNSAPVGADVFSATGFTSGGSNLIGDGTSGNGFTNGTAHDQVGTTALPLDPGIGTLGNNGGTTPTIALSSTSIARQTNFAAHLPLDQRGVPRPQRRADIGAYEAVSAIKGQLRGWGYNSSGQVGPGYFTTPALGYNLLAPVICTGLPNGIEISGGAFHSLGLEPGSTGDAWGYASNGQIGNGVAGDPSGAHDVNAPLAVLGIGGTGTLTSVLHVGGGAFHSLAVMNDGTVTAWGSNGNGQLGNSTTTDSTTPIQVQGVGGGGQLSGIITVSGGGAHSLALRSDGTVFAWGSNGNGQLGNNTFTDSSTPVQVVDANGSPFTGVIAISAGGQHSLAVKADGTVWAWGANANGQVGDGEHAVNHSTPVQVLGVSGTGFLTGIVGVSGNDQYSVALGANGTVYAWGADKEGQLGNGLGGSGTDGDGDSDVPVRVIGVGQTSGSSTFLSSIVGISTSNSTGLALKDDGTVYAWGYGGSGQLGINTGHTTAADVSNTNSTSPVQVHGISNVGFLTGIVEIAGGGYHDLTLQNLPPAAIAQNYTAITNSTLTVSANGTPSGLLTGATDTESDPLSVANPGTTATTNGSVTTSADGSFTYTPTLNYNGADTFTYQVSDPYGISSAATVTINIVGIPTADAQNVPVVEDGSQAVTLTGSDPNTPPLSLTYTVTASPANGVLTGTAPNLTYTPNAGYVGPDSFQFTASNGTATSSAATVSITVTPATATKFLVSAASPQVAGTPFNFTVTAEDAAGSTATTYAGTAAFSSTDTQAVLPASATLTNGTGTFSATLKTAGSQTITASDTPNSITGTSNAITVSAAASGHITFVQQPTTTATGTAVTPAPSVLVTDAFDNAIASTSVTVTLATGTGTLSGVTTQTTGANGVATFPGLTIDRPGQKTLQAAGGNSLTVTSNTFTVTASDRLNASGVNISATKRVSFTAAVASVTDTNTTSPASDFTAVIDWGDGTATTPGTVTGGSGSFTVSGTHSYVTQGSYTVKVTITDTQSGGPTATANSTATVRDITDPTTTASLSPSAPNGQNGSYTTPVTVTLSATDPDDTAGQITTFYSVDNGTQQTYSAPFTVSGVGSHTVKYFSADAAGNTEAAHSLTITIAAPPVTTPILHTYSAGLQMISVPENYTGVALTFSDTSHRRVTWNPVTLQYDTRTDLAPGIGYWVRFSQSTSLYDTGVPTPTNTPFKITLQPGWNMIGDPYRQAVSLSNVTVQDPAGTTGSFNQAVTGGVLYGTLYTFPAGASAYQSLGQGSSINTYQGYWIYAYRTCTLLVPAP